VIKIESLYIEELRGIRKLSLNMNRERFAVVGPNGSGKSGIIDALEFGLTGEIGRLTGRGLSDVSVAEHGPHVSSAKSPEKAFVTVTVFIPKLNKSATITRHVKTRNKPTIVPNDPDIIQVLEEVRDHPEMALSRRDIVKFILIEPAKRSEAVQRLLKLDEVGQTRRLLNTAKNRVETAQKTAEGTLTASGQTLAQAVGVSQAKAADILKHANTRRKLLGLKELTELTTETKIDDGVVPDKDAKPFDKKTAVSDLKAFIEFSNGSQSSLEAERATVETSFAQLENDPKLMAAFQRQDFYEAGIGFISGPQCPLCDHEWPSEQHIRDHVGAKIEQSKAAKKIQDDIKAAGLKIAAECARVLGILSPVKKLAIDLEDKDLQAAIAGYEQAVRDIQTASSTFRGLHKARVALKESGLLTSKDVQNRLDASLKVVEEKPDLTDTHAAQTYLNTVNLRVDDLRKAKKAKVKADAAAKAAKATYDTYCEVMEAELTSLYDEVKDDFAAYYRDINYDNELKFNAKFLPSEGALDLKVTFFEEGLFPPAAYHSEGHQDGMGLCLYLALMKKLFGDQFTFALLDDVVMSVDAGHRLQLCKMLKTKFPNTQFVLTTHERMWAEQMKTTHLVEKKNVLTLYGWTLEGGPITESGSEIWSEIDADLKKNNPNGAAAALRHHLEFVCRVIAQELGASPQFKLDGNYDLGDLLTANRKRIKALFADASAAEKSWGNTENAQRVETMRQEMNKANAQLADEDGYLNKNVHFNEWANMTGEEFSPVATAFRGLLDQFRCGNCQTWLYVSYDGRNAIALRCHCQSLNLVKKPPSAAK
jgi:ABC-type multidrug transport system ATPase subunit